MSKDNKIIEDLWKNLILALNKNVDKPLSEKQKEELEIFIKTPFQTRPNKIKDPIAPA